MCGLFIIYYFILLYGRQVEFGESKKQKIKQKIKFISPKVKNKVYEISNIVVSHPDVLHTFRNLDFGKGFYVTTVREQAERWAKRKADFESGTPAILNRI